MAADESIIIMDTSLINLELFINFKNKNDKNKLMFLQVQVLSFNENKNNVHKQIPSTEKNGLFIFKRFNLQSFLKASFLKVLLEVK